MSVEHPASNWEGSMARICHVRFELKHIPAKSSFRDNDRIRLIRVLLIGLGYFAQIRTAVLASVVVDLVLK